MFNMQLKYIFVNRLSTWARKQAKLKTMVNVQKWTQIQKQFPSLIEKRNSGDDTCQGISNILMLLVFYLR